jgi:hypothetical protein
MRSTLLSIDGALASRSRCVMRVRR